MIVKNTLRYAVLDRVIPEYDIQPFSYLKEDEKKKNNLFAHFLILSGPRSFLDRC